MVTMYNDILYIGLYHIHFLLFVLFMNLSPFIMAQTVVNVLCYHCVSTGEWQVLIDSMWVQTSCIQV